MYDFERPCVEENGENDDIANEYPCFVLQLFQIKYTLLPLNSKCFNQCYLCNKWKSSIK